MNTLQYVQACLERTQVPLKEVAAGAGVGHRWLLMLRRGQIPNPGFSRVQLLADYFHRVGEVPVLPEAPDRREQVR